MQKAPPPPSITCNSLSTPSGLECAWTGPALSQGPLPAFIYFSISAKGSLCLDPFNQPVAFLAEKALRVFSWSLPHHEEGSDYGRGIPAWAKDLQQGKDFVALFLQQVESDLSFLSQQGIIESHNIAAGGLSRGGFMATHLAARLPSIHSVVAFAPLTGLVFQPDFAPLKDTPLAQSLSLSQHVKTLTKTSVRFYIGNRDERVGTVNAFQFIQALTEEAYHARIRSPHTELFITPSIGHKGHGTPPEVFYDGARWIAKRLYDKTQERPFS